MLILRVSGPDDVLRSIAVGGGDGGTAVRIDIESFALGIFELDRAAGEINGDIIAARERNELITAGNGLWYRSRCNR